MSDRVQRRSIPWAAYAERSMIVEPTSFLGWFQCNELLPEEQSFLLLPLLMDVAIADDDSVKRRYCISDHSRSMIYLCFDEVSQKKPCWTSTPFSNLNNEHVTPIRFNWLSWSTILNIWMSTTHRHSRSVPKLRVDLHCHRQTMR